MNTLYNKIWDIAKVVLRGNFIAINTYIFLKGRSQMNTLTICLKILEKKANKGEKGNN